MGFYDTANIKQLLKLENMQPKNSTAKIINTTLKIFLLVDLVMSVISIGYDFMKFVITNYKAWILYVYIYVMCSRGVSRYFSGGGGW